MFKRDIQYYKFCSYGFLKNLKFFEPFFILYLHEAEISYFHIGFLITIRAVATNLTEIPSGVIADSIGRRKSMILSFLSYIVSFFIFFVFPNFFMLAIAMIFFAFGDSFRTGTHKAMIMHYLKEKDWTEYRSKYYGKTRSWSQRGSALSALIAASIVFYTGNYRSAFAFSIIPYFLGLFLIISYPTWFDNKIKDRLKGRKGSGIKNVMMVLFENLKKPEIRRRLLSTSVPKGFFESSKDYIQPLIVSFTISLPMFLKIELDKRIAIITGITYFLIFVLTSFASALSSSVANKFKSTESFLNKILLGGILSLFLAGITFLFGSTFISVLFFIAFYGLHNLRVPTAVSFFSDKIDHDVMATALSVEAQLKTIIVAVLSPIIGLFIDIFDIGTALSLVSILGICGYCIYFLLLRKKV